MSPVVEAGVALPSISHVPMTMGGIICSVAFSSTKEHAFHRESTSLARSVDGAIVYHLPQHRYTLNGDVFDSCFDGADAAPTTPSIRGLMASWADVKVCQK